MQYLRINVELRRDNAFDLAPIYQTDDASGAIQNPDSEVRATILDSNGNLLLEHRLPAREYCVFGGSSSDMLAIGGAVPLPKDAARIQFYRGSVLLSEQELMPSQLKVELLWQPGRVVSGIEQISWKTSGDDRQKATYRLQYSNNNGRDWLTVAVTGAARKASVDIDTLPGGGSCRFAVLASAGLTNQRVRSEPFKVPLKPCGITIISPLDGQTVDRDDPVSLIGSACYLETRQMETKRLGWHSSIDGTLGAGPVLDGVRLSPGKHTLTMTAGDGRRKGQASVEVTVRSRRRRASNG